MWWIFNKHLEMQNKNKPINLIKYNLKYGQATKATA